MRCAEAPLSLAESDRSAHACVRADPENWHFILDGVWGVSTSFPMPPREGPEADLHMRPQCLPMSVSMLTARERASFLNAVTKA